MNQTFADEFFRTRYSQFSVPPRSVCQNHHGETPVVTKILKGPVVAQLGARKEENPRLLQASIDAAVLLFALLHMPARQTILNLAVRPFVLFNNHHMNPVVR